ncbi:MAG: hypothetical protein LBT83_04675 [Tannerella sp.]|jgi:hypothetical protein|nr:hypothetical protein [Tannerella sp.]
MMSFQGGWFRKAGQDSMMFTVDELMTKYITSDTWDYFCPDNLIYKGHNLTVLYDRDGSKYKKGKGLMLFCRWEIEREKKRCGNNKCEI